MLELVRRVGIVALVLAVAGACSGQATSRASSATPAGSSASPTGASPGPTSSGSAGPTATASPMVTTAGLVGWLDGGVVVAFTVSSLDDLSGPPATTTLSRYDPRVGGWQDLATVSGVTEGQFVTDGQTVAWLDGGPGVSMVRPDGSRSSSPSVGGISPDDWIQYRLAPLAQGGYLVADAATLDRLSADGQRWQRQPLPAGYVALSGTSDAAWFAVARQTERDREGGTILGSSISLFDAQTNVLVHVVGDGAMAPSPAAGGLLEYLFEHAWYRVGTDGHPHLLATASTAVTDQTLSPDGSFTAGGCPAPRTLSLPVPLAVDHPGPTVILAATTTTTAAPEPATCPAFFGPVAAPDVAPELVGTDLDGWAWATDDRVAAIVDYGDLIDTGATQVLVIEVPGSTPLQVPLSGVP